MLELPDNDLAGLAGLRLLVSSGSPLHPPERAQIALFLELLAELPIVVDLESPQRAFGTVLDLAREHQLSSYDATYLELAMRHDGALATLDVALGKAAQSLGITVYGDSD